MNRDAKSALQRLMEGNERFLKGESIHPNRFEERRLETALEQKPFAIILGCSDSRASPEIIFDQGIGDLFIVRVAGNVVGPVELDTIAYAAHYLGAALIFVKGHENCGAVTAVYQGNTRHIETVASLIEPAILHSKSAPDHPIEYAIKDNVLNVVNQLKEAPVLQSLLQEGKLTVAGGFYHFQTGEVELLTHN